MAQETKTMLQLVKDANELCGTAGTVSFGMGMRMAPISADPKKVATELLKAGDQFEAIADAVRKLANDVIDYDAAKASLIIVPSNGMRS